MAGHVLFVDHLDNEIMELKLGLEAEGIQVTVQPNPKQAIDDAKVNVPDLVVIEVLTRPVGGLRIWFHNCVWEAWFSSAGDFLHGILP